MGGGTHDVEPEATDIVLFKYIYINPAAINPAHIKSASITESEWTTAYQWFGIACKPLICVWQLDDRQWSFGLAPLP